MGLLHGCPIGAVSQICDLLMTNVNNVQSSFFRLTVKVHSDLKMSEGNHNE